MRNDSGKPDSSNPLGGYFENVEKFSDEHRKDMDKFQNLLMSMEKTDISPKEKGVYLSLKEMVKNFDNYLVKHTLILTDTEKKNLTQIFGISHSLPVKIKMLEDLIHKVKMRYQADRNRREEEARVKDEVSELKASHNFLLDWLKLTKFSLDYGTITLFKHKLNDSAFHIIRKKALQWQYFIEKNIKSILDTEYYLLSTLEYNALVSIVELKKSLDKLVRIGGQAAYDAKDIGAEVDEFAELYLTLVKNSDYAVSAYKKIFKARKAEHGLFGALMSFLDKPIFENRPVKRTGYEIFTDSITGFLLSYYTSKERIIVRTDNQILYLLVCDGKLDEMKKHLTPEAEKRLESVKEKEKSDDIIQSERLEELQRVTDNFFQQGEMIEEKIFKSESKSLYHSYLKDIGVKPFIRIIRLVEAFISYFVDLINNREIFILEYDSNEYKNYFDIDTGIYDISGKYNMEEFNLIGSKLKDLQNLTLPEKSREEDLIIMLTEKMSDKKKLKPSIEHARNALFSISNLSYKLAVRINELISFYTSQKEILNENLEKNYDFFLNATLKKNNRVKLYRIFREEKISLKGFLEMSCSMGFHISRLLRNPVLSALVEEKESLSMLVEKIKGDNYNQKAVDHEFSLLEEDDSIVQDIDRMYRDTLTGLWKKEYLHDQIMHKLYDSKENYSMDRPRFVYMCEISGFDRFNSVYGHETTDKLLVQVTRKIKDEIYSPGKHEDDILLREGAGKFFGYLNDTSLMECVDRFAKISIDVKGIYIRSGDMDIGKIVINFGVYEERKGSNMIRNIEIARNLLFYAGSEENKNIAFIKDPHFVIRERDFDRMGDLKEGLITIV
jgi:diguanylate cyclase (GGDEF)-like protein